MTKLPVTVLHAFAVLLSITAPHCHVIATGIGQQQQQQQHEHRKELLAGGYQEVADVTQDPYIDQAAELVLSTLQESSRYSFASTAVSYRIIHAEQQVVAGMNYKLTLLFGDEQPSSDENEGGNCVGACKVIVYNHFGDLSITDWVEELTCKEALSMEDDNAGDEN